MVVSEWLVSKHFVISSACIALLIVRRQRCVKKVGVLTGYLLHATTIREIVASRGSHAAVGEMGTANKYA